jgi:hypothetical protein
MSGNADSGVFLKVPAGLCFCAEDSFLNWEMGQLVQMP